jgi:hypothetical protein
MIIGVSIGFCKRFVNSTKKAPAIAKAKHYLHFYPICYNYHMTAGKFDESTQINLLLFLLAAVSVAASFYPNWGLWGLDSPRSFPAWFRLLLLGLILILAIPQVIVRFNLFLEARIKTANESGLRIIYFCIAASLVVLFIIFSSDNNFLGDGFTVLANIKNGVSLLSTEPLEYLVHFAIFKLFGFSDNAIRWPYLITSYGCGILFLIGLYIFVKNRIALLLSLGIVVCFVSIQFYFGYVENYTFRFVILFFYSLSAIADLGNKRLSARTVLLLCIAVGFHISSAVMIPSVIFLALQKYPRMRIILPIAYIVIALFVGVEYLTIIGKIDIDQVLVPLRKIPSNPYSLFSIQHLSDLANLAFLNCPLLIIALMARKFRQSIVAPLSLFLIGPPILLTILVDPKLGAYRDWDLLSISAAPIMALLISVFLLEDRKDRPWSYSIFFAWALFGILHTGSWIYQNSSQEKGYPIVREEVKRDIHYSREFKSGFRNKSWAMLANRYGRDSDELLRALFEAYYGDPLDCYNSSQLIEALAVLGRKDEAVKMTQQNWTKCIGEPYSASKLSATMINIGRLSEAEQICQGFLSTGQQDTSIYNNLAYIKQFEGQSDSAVYYLDKALSFNINKSPKILLSFYVTCFIKGYDKLAIAGINRIMPGLSDSNRPFANSMLQILSKGSAASIDSLRTVLTKSMKASASP